MSGDDFIYSAIADDNVNAFDLSVIANTLASTDKLVRQNKQLGEENERLRDKISSLRESALQIKNLYETEVSKTTRTEVQLATYVSQCQQLEQRCLVAENERVNTDLLLKERVAEYDRLKETNEARYRVIVSDLVRCYADHQPTQGHNTDIAAKWKDLKVHAATVEKLNLPDEVKAFFHHGHLPGQLPPRSKRKKRREMRDQECQTTELASSSRMQNSSTNTVEPYPVQRELPVEKKTFSDKGTMLSTMSTITRSTCTSAFIKRVDVGVNFPEVTHKSVDEILRECVPLPPLLLSPITEILPLRAAVETQTDFSWSPECERSPVVLPEKPQLVSCGTITSLKNIRKRIDYRTMEGGGGGTSFQQQYISIAEQLYAKNIKKEEQMSSITPQGPKMPAGFGSDDSFGRMHPHLSTIWTLLGETIFSLMGSSGRLFDGQCYSIINEQLTTIRDMIEADGRRESELMSAMFSNVSATVEAAAGYGKERTTAFPLKVTTRQQDQASPPTTQPQGPAESFGSENTAIPAGSFDRNYHVRQTIDRERVIENDDVPPLERDSVVPCPELSTSSSSQTKEINIGGNPSHTPTSISDGLPGIVQHLNANVRIGKNTRIEVAQSKNTVDVLDVAPKCIIDPSNRNDSVLVDNESDRIAQELRLMEDGAADGPLTAKECAYSRNEDRRGSVSIEEILAGATMTCPEKVDNVETASPLAEERIIPLARPSTPPKIIEPCSSSTGTFVSPIKVKETNDLVKDQFKTPTQPPISKRKLRIRRSDESISAIPSYHCSKRRRFGELNTLTENTGRVSPTIEFLLEDDWDQKFSSIKAAMFSSIDGSHRPLSPIADRFEQNEDLDAALETDNDTTTTTQANSNLQRGEHSDIAEKETHLLVERLPVEPIPIIDRIKSADNNPAEDKRREQNEEVQMDMDSVSKESLSIARIVPIESTKQKSAPASAAIVESVQTIATGSEKHESVANDNVPQKTVEIGSTPREDNANNGSTQYANVGRAPSTIHTAPLDLHAMDGGEIVESGDVDKQSSKTNELKIIVDVVDSQSPESPVLDSPMSPPMHETGSNPKVLYSLDSPLSPPLPSSDEAESAAPPQAIPLDHVDLRLHQQRTRGPIDRAIECFKLERRFEVVNMHAGRLNPQEKSAMPKLSEVLQRYIQSPWTDAIVAETLVQVLAISQDARTIALTVLESVISRGDIIVNMLCSPPAPPIPLTQQKLVLLVRHLSPLLNHEPLDRVLMRELDRRMFQLKSEATVLLPGLIALTFLYIGLEDSRPPAVVPWHRNYSVRLYLFKCLYYFRYKCLPLVYYVLRAFPFALPKKGSPHYDNADAMIGTIRTILMNINYSEGGSTGPDAAMYKKRELFGLLTYQYGYQPGSPTYEELVVNLVEKIRANRLRNVPHALILVAKRKSYEWARQHIIQHRLYPLLNDYLKLLDLMSSRATDSGTAGSSGTGCDLAGLDERIVACIFTISSIMKTHPSHEDVSGVMQIFTSIVQLAQGRQAIQEEAIAGLVKFSRFGHADIFERLTHWHPTYPVSDRIKLMLATLLHRKDLRFWKQLLQNMIV